MICRWWCHDLTLTLDTLHFIWSVDDDVKTSHLPWELQSSSDLWMMMSIPQTYLESLTLHLICWWWRQHLTLTLVAFHFIWSVDDDIITLHLSLESYTSTDVYMMMSSPYTYLGSPTLYPIYRWWRQVLGRLTLHLISRWWRQDLSLTFRALHVIWSADDDVTILHLPWEPCSLSDL